MEEKSYKYAAFISYRHGGIDEKVGAQLQKEIERYKLPRKIARQVGRKTLGKVFRDKNDLRSASNLSAIIRQGIDDSEFLVVVCTRRYQDSVWCMEEIAYFIETRGREKIVVVLVEGEPDESFPKLLTEVEQDGKMVHIEPLAVDIRAGSDRAIVRQLSKEKLRFVSQMLNMSYDDLRQRQKERFRRQILTVAAAAVLGLSIFTGVIVNKNIQLNEAMQQTLRGQSYYLSEYAGEAYDNGDRMTAVLLALQALPEDLEAPDRPYVPEVMNALTSALGIYDYSSGYQADKVFRFDEESYDTKVEFSEDGELLLVEKYQTAAGNILEGRLYIYTIQEQELVAEYNLADIQKTYNNSLSRSSRLLKDSQTLIYLSPEGMRAVDIYTGQELFSGAAGSQLTLSDRDDVIAVYSNSEAKVYYYNMEGKETAVTDLDEGANYSLYCISPDSSIAVLSQDGNGQRGILLTDVKSGQSMFVDKSESCSKISFIDDHSLCFVRQDTQMKRSHIVVFDLQENSDDYLVDTDKNIGDVALSGYGSCFFYSGKEITEISRKTGKVTWKNTFPSDVASICAEGEYLAVTLQNGESYFYHGKKKELMNQVQGNGVSFYMLGINEEGACLRDFWGQNIRYYSMLDHDDDKVQVLDFSSDMVPEKWYTASSGGDTFLLDLKNGISDRVLTFSAEDLQLLADTTLDDLEYESFENLSVEAAQGYVSVLDYAYGDNAHFDINTMERTLAFDEDAFYFYNEDKSKLMLSRDGKLSVYEGATGEEIETCELPEGYDRGVLVEGYQVFGNEESVCIRKMDGARAESENVLSDAVLYTFSDKKELLFCRDVSEKEWFVYSLKEGRIVCRGEAGTYASTMIFNEGNYFLNDYTEVYDTNTWKKVLDLSAISTGVYGVTTSEELPYFVVWYQSGNTGSSGKNVGANVAYLYSKSQGGELMGVVPNYVTMAKDGQVIVYDGDHSLYKVPLYRDEEILRLAKEYAAGAKLTAGQREQYHIYEEEF